MLAELLPQLIVLYLGKISYIEDQASRASGGPWAWSCFPGRQNRICARQCDFWAPAVS